MATKAAAKKKKRSSRKATSTKGPEESKSKSVALRKKGGTALALPANWREELAKDAAEESERVPAGAGNKIILKRDGQFGYQGADLGDSITGVIVAHCVYKTYYDRPYDEDNPTPPACFALKLDHKNLAPSDNSPDKQSELCADCWANEFKSDARGRGKACKDKHRIAFVHQDDLQGMLDGDGNAELAMLELPPTSGGNFKGFIKKLNKAVGIPSYAALVTLAMDEDEEWQVVTFEFVEELQDELQYLLRQMRKDAEAMIMEEPDASNYEAPEEKGPRRGKSGGSKKAASKKKRRSRVS